MKDMPPIIRIANAVLIVVLLACIVSKLPLGALRPDGGSGIKPVVPGMHVLIVEETGQDRLWPYNAKTLDEFAMDHCAKVNGTPEKRIYDKDIDLSNASRDWQEAMADAKKDGHTLPWLEVWGVRKPVSEPLPKSLDETLSELKAHSK